MDLTAIKLTLYSAEGEKLGSESCSLARSETSYLADTPETNRRLVRWVESKLGQKIARGECWDAAAQGITHAGSSMGPGDGYDFGRQLGEDETPFPGDIAKDKNGKHVVVVRGVLPDGSVGILQQNWMNGAEAGGRSPSVNRTRKVSISGVLIRLPTTRP